jgi:hypothetical protein
LLDRLLSLRCPAPIASVQLSHGHLRGLGQRHEQLAAQLKAAEAQAQRYAGLPADLAAAKAAHLEKLQELEKLRGRLAAGLAGL